MRRAKFMLVIVDVCLIVYWVATAMHLIPPESAFKDYGNEVVQAWNWSFFPLDLLAVAAGCWGVAGVWPGFPGGGCFCGGVWRRCCMGWLGR